MSTQDQLAQLNREESAAKVQASLAESLERLRSNRDFRKLIVDGYLTTEAVRLVHLKSDPAQQEPAQQAAIVRDIDAIGALQQYFRTVDKLGEMAGASIKTIEETRNELLADQG